MHKNTWEGHFLKIFKKCEVFFTQKVVFFQVFGWCFGLVFLGFELVFWAHDFLATLCKSPIPRACFIDSNYYFKMSSARKIGQFCLLSLKQSSGVSSRLGSSMMPLSRTVPTINTSFNNNFMPSVRGMASGTDSELVEFLKEEIPTEKSNQKKVVDIPGFDVKKEGAELTFTKNLQGEKIVISLNVNHTVDSAEEDDGNEEAPEMKSQPNFEIDIVKSSGQTLSFSCSFIGQDEDPPSADDDQFNDVFAIDEVTMFKGEDWSDKKYAVAGDILDGHLYDLFMNMLNDRGIDRKFADRLSDYCSAYEHGMYIEMLEELKKFASS